MKVTFNNILSGSIPPGSVILKDINNNEVMIIGIDRVEIHNPQEAALTMVKSSMEYVTKREPKLGWNGAITIHIEDNYRIELNPAIEKPKNWDEFVREFSRVIRNKAFA